MRTRPGNRPLVLLFALAASLSAGAVPEIPASPNALRDKGKAIYDRWCTVCHGEKGDGHGPAATALDPRPRDFTRGIYKLKSTLGADPPLDSDLLRTIGEGIPGTAMPAFGDILSPDEVTSAVVYLKFFSLSAFQSATLRPFIVPPPPLSTPSSIERGREVYLRAGCAKCHGDEGKSDGPSAAELEDDSGRPSRPANLTEPWTFKSSYGLDQIFLRISLGMPGTPMPGYADSLSVADRWYLIQYLYTLRRKPLWELTDADAIRALPIGGVTDAVARGRYLTQAQACRLCHNPVDEKGEYIDSLYLAGGMPVVAYPFGVWYSRNLTPDIETGLGAWSEDMFLRAFQDGRSPKRALTPFDMPWPFFHAEKPEDARAIFAYLKTLKPVKNPAPPPTRFGFIETVIYKAGSAFWGAPVSIDYYPGNAGSNLFQSPAPGSLRYLDWIGVGVIAAWIFLATRRRKRTTPVARNLYGVFSAGWSREREGKAKRSPLVVVARLLLGLVILAIALVAVGLYIWPPMGSMPPDQVSKMMGYLPEPTGANTLAEKAVAERGKYLVTIAPCGMCHTAGSLWPWKPGAPPLSGGAKVNWRVFGTSYSRNLTPDMGTGIGACSMAALRRAIKSGIRCTPDSHGKINPMHWQDMPWDIFSNWSEEDLYAIMFYLKSIPAVEHRAPDPEPPKAGDRPGDSFFIGDYSY